MPGMNPAIQARLRSLTADDFLGARGIRALKEIVKDLETEGDPHWATPLLFETMERLHAEDLGAPGPIVHFLEKIGGYEEELRRSLRRRPTHYTVWMANRIANDPAAADDRAGWLSELRQVAGRPDVDEELRAEAADYVQFQGGSQ